MTNPRTISSLFTPEPPRWGLRGDPYLWREMQSHFEGTPLPASSDGVAALVTEAFATLTGHTLAESEPFFLERLSHGGMSSGMISTEFWRKQIIPMMRVRFSDLNDKSNNPQPIP